MTPTAATEALRLALPTLLGNLDDATFEAIRPLLPVEWIERAGGELLFNEGEPSDSLYFVISGRLQASVALPDNTYAIVGEIGRGESVGEMGAFTNEPRRATVTALRDTVLARIELAAFQEMLKASPALALNLNRIIIDRLQRRNTSQKPTHNVTNLAVLCVSDGLQSSTAIARIVDELKRQQHNVLHVTSAMIDEAAGRPGASQATSDEPDDHRWLVNHLDELESRYAMVFYEADPTPTAWTRRCLRVADEVLLLATADTDAKLSAIETECFSDAPSASRLRQTMVLIHPANADGARNTRRFLDTRPAVSRHFHVRLENEKDVARLARHLSNTAIGLVLAGGGARGLAHIGVFRALEEAGIPIDSVGGTSIGSIMGACYAFDWGWKRVYDENKGPFLSNPTLDYNWLPMVSLLSGRRLAKILDASPIHGIDIEDLWLPYYCVSTNYTKAAEHVHNRGNLQRAITASMAIPGVFPPVVNGADLLVDGGCFNNMPVDVMARTGVGTILAVDLRPQDKSRGDWGFDKVPGTWSLIFDHFRKKADRRYPLPSIVATLMTTTFLSSAQKVTTLLGDVDLLFNPDVSRFGMLEWRSYDELVDEGYRHAKEMLAAKWPLREGSVAIGRARK